jgi:hypothetical protein
MTTPCAVCVVIDVTDPDVTAVMTPPVPAMRLEGIGSVAVFL